MPREVEISNIERNFILEALTQDVRLDGRKLDQLRKLEFEYGDEYGTVTLRLGKTRFAPLQIGVRHVSNGRTQGTCASIGGGHQATGGAQV